VFEAKTHNATFCSYVCRARFRARVRAAPKIDEIVFAEARTIMELARPCLKRWAARYAQSEHAKKHCIETFSIIERMDDWMLRNRTSAKPEPPEEAIEIDEQHGP
jgi:hypothetical protein